MLYSKVSLPRVSSRHKRPSQTSLRQEVTFSSSKKSLGTAAAWFLFLFVLTHTTYLLLQGQGRIPFIFVPLLYHRHTELAKVCYMKFWTDDRSNWAPFKSICQRHTLIIHLTLHSGAELTRSGHECISGSQHKSFRTEPEYTLGSTS